jgi:hypothetical protein
MIAPLATIAVLLLVLALALIANHAVEQRNRSLEIRLNARNRGLYE